MNIRSPEVPFRPCTRARDRATSCPHSLAASAMTSGPRNPKRPPILLGWSEYHKLPVTAKSPAVSIIGDLLFRHKAYIDDSSPGPVYSLPRLETSVKALPHWSMSTRKFPPSEAKYVSRLGTTFTWVLFLVIDPSITTIHRLNVPGPGNYDLNPAKKQTVETAPSYSFGLRARGRRSDTAPAPNNYQLPQIVGHKHTSKKSAPQYSLTGRSKVGGFDEDLKKVPPSI